jgi:hypothetical protein
MEPAVEPREVQHPLAEAAPMAAQAAVVPTRQTGELPPAPALKVRKAGQSVAAAKARMVRAAQRAAGVKARPEPAAAAVESEPVGPRREPLREVRLEIAVQSPATSEQVVEERQLTGLDMRRLGL